MCVRVHVDLIQPLAARNNKRCLFVWKEAAIPKTIPIRSSVSTELRVVTDGQTDTGPLHYITNWYLLYANCNVNCPVAYYRLNIDLT